MAGEDVEIALAQGLAEGPDAALLLVDLVDVEDVDHRLAQLQAGGVFPVLAGDDRGRVLCEFGDALEHVFRAGGAAEILQQLGIDRRVGRQHEEVAAAARQVEIGDEGAHQPGLADARRQREAQRGKFPLEAFDAGIELAGFPPAIPAGSILAAPVDQVGNFGEALEAFLLRRAEREALGDFAPDALALLCRSGCSCVLSFLDRLFVVIGHRVADVERIVVTAPFAAAQDGAGDLGAGEVFEVVEAAGEGRRADHQRAAFADLVGQQFERIARQALRGDIEEIGLARLAVAPPFAFVLRSARM